MIGENDGGRYDWECPPGPDDIPPTRVGNWRSERERCTVYIGRGSLWGNPYVTRGRAHQSRFPVIESDDPLGDYEQHVRASAEMMAALPSLRGQVLGCYCVRLTAPMPLKREGERCHGHVLARMADETDAARGGEET